MAGRGVEVEIKLRISDAGVARMALRRQGFVLQQRQHEHDVLFDTPDLALRQSRRLLRLRRIAGRWILTFKGPPAPDTRYKARTEIELEIGRGERLIQILAQLGYRPVFVYEKIRSNYQQAGSSGIASLDRTPIGLFLELEGPRAWIDRTAKALGFTRQDYITKSYAALYVDYCRERGREPANMVFGS